MTKKRSAGTRSKYDPDAHPLKAWMLGQRGLTNKEIAKGLKISSATLHTWQRTYPEFKKALGEGKDVADAKVIKALFRRACGFRTTEKRVIVNPDGSVRKEAVDKEIPGDPTAQKFWLMNRKSKEWKDKRELGGEDGAPIPVQVYVPDNNRRG